MLPLHVSCDCVQGSCYSLAPAPLSPLSSLSLHSPWTVASEQSVVYMYMRVVVLEHVCGSFCLCTYCVACLPYVRVCVGCRACLGEVWGVEERERERERESARAREVPWYWYSSYKLCLPLPPGWVQGPIQALGTSRNLLHVCIWLMQAMSASNPGLVGCGR
jgi:hypothetical protein